MSPSSSSSHSTRASGASSSSSHSSTSSHSSKPKSSKYSFDHNGSMSHYKDLSFSNLDKAPMSHADSKSRQAKEAEKKKHSTSKSISTSSDPKREKRKQQNRDSNRATEAARRAHMSGLKDVYTGYDVKSGILQSQLSTLKKRNRDAEEYAKYLEKQLKH